MATEASTSGTTDSMPSWQANFKACRPLMSTGDAYNAPLEPSHENGRSPLDRNNYFKSCQWSPDGTTLLTSTADNVLSTFILPPDLLEETDKQPLVPYHQHNPPGPVHATAIHPSFSLSAPSTAIYLASIPDMPLRLISPFSSKILATYPLVNPNTENFVAPHSLLFDSYASYNTTHFLAGTDSQISIFDLNRPGDAPHTTLKTIPSKRKKLVGGGVGMKGLVSTMALSTDGLLAAGTFTRWIGLYDGAGRGSEMGVFQLGRDDSDRDGTGAGSGVTQLAWTESGKYLVAAERMSDGISVWDVRGTGKRLAWLSGRGTMTLQRMSLDIVGSTVISGDTGGSVKLWDAVGDTEGVVKPTSEVKLHDDAISSAAMHPSAAIMATCSGQRQLRQTGGGPEEPFLSPAVPAIESSTVDNTLRIWSLYSDIPQSED